MSGSVDLTAATVAQRKSHSPPPLTRLPKVKRPQERVLFACRCDECRYPIFRRKDVIDLGSVEFPGVRPLQCRFYRDIHPVQHIFCHVGARCLDFGAKTKVSLEYW
jgi:hypothetical protein